MHSLPAENKATVHKTFGDSTATVMLPERPAGKDLLQNFQD